MYYKNNIEKKLIVDTMINLTTLKECAAIVIINMEELKNHGIVLMINFMLGECAKTAILMNIIEKGERKAFKFKKDKF
jgi:hypothetical protein